MKKKIINGLLFAAALVVATSSFVSCKDYEGDNIARQQEQLSLLEQALQVQIADMVNYCKVTECKAARDLLEGRIKALENAGYITNAALNGYATETWVQTQIPNIIKDNNSLLNQAVTTVINQYLQNSGLQPGETLDLSKYALKSELPDMTQYLTNSAFTTKMAQYYTKAEVDALQSVWQNAIFQSDEFKALQLLANNAKTAADNAKTAADNAQTKANEAYDKAVAAGTAADNAKTAADNAKTAADNAQTAADNAKTAADNAQAKANEAFDKAVANASSIEDLKKADEEMKKDIEEIQKQLADVQKAIDNLDGRLKKLITGVEIQAAYNPVFGYLNSPFGVKSNVLVANYGEANNAVQFPTNNPASYYNANSLFDDKEWALVQNYLPEIKQDYNKFNAGDIIINEEEGNAGTLYVTINHASDNDNVDFTGTEFSLRTSTNQVSLVKLSPLEPANDVLLTYGYKRAAVNGVSENGFYAAKATVKWDVAKEVAPTYDMISIAKDLKDQIDVNRAERTVKINFGAIAGIIYQNVQDVLPALGVQANWQDEEGFKRYTTKYELAATAVKALNFGLAYDYTIKPKQWISYIDGNRIDNEIREMIALELNIDPLNLGKIVVDMPAGKVIAQVLDDDGNPVKVKDQYGNDINLEVDITQNVQDIYDTLNAALQKYNDKVDDMNNIPTSISNAVKKMGTNMADRVCDFVNKYVSRVNKVIKKANNLINHANNFLQPLLLSETTDGKYIQLSRLWAAPTQINDGDLIPLLPTTYNGELIVPCYMKNLCVTNVFKGYGLNAVSAVNGAADCVAKLGDANNAISSKTLYMHANDWGGFNAAGLGGYTYEITYTAIDYSGKVSGKKYYIYVK